MRVRSTGKLQQEVTHEMMLLSDYFLIHVTYTDLQQLYGVVLNLILKNSGSYYCDQQLDGNH